MHFTNPFPTFVPGAAMPAHTSVKRVSGVLQPTVADTVITAVLGEVQNEVFDDLQVVSVNTLTNPGDHQGIAAGAIAVDAIVYLAAAGKLAASGTVRRGVATTAASADGDVFSFRSLP